MLTLKKRRVIENRNLLISCLLWALVAGLRAYSIGNDTLGYTAFFEGTNIKGVGYGTVQFPGDTIEWGFVTLSRFYTISRKMVRFFCCPMAS